MTRDFMKRTRTLFDLKSSASRLKIILPLVTLLVFSAGLAGCSLQRSGVIRVAGSTTVLPLAQEGADRFMDMRNGTNILVQGGGSSVGISQLKERIIDIAMSSRELTADESDGTIMDNRIALDVIALVVNPGLKIENLSKQEVKDIFTGNIRNWSEVGGEDAAIVVVVRDSASGTRQMFDQIALDKEQTISSAIECNSNGIVRETVGSTPDSIGYVSLGYVNSLIRAINYDGVVPSEQSGKDGSYPLSRYLHMFTGPNPKQLAQDFIAYVLSPDFQSQVVAQDYIPISEN